MSPRCTKIAITRLILKLRDSSFACKPDFTRRKIIFCKIGCRNILLLQGAKEEGGKRQGDTESNNKKSMFQYFGQVKKFKINTYMRLKTNNKMLGSKYFFWQKLIAAPLFLLESNLCLCLIFGV